MILSLLDAGFPYDFIMQLDERDLFLIVGIKSALNEKKNQELENARRS